MTRLLREPVLRLFGAFGFELRRKLPFAPTANEQDLFYCFRLLYGRPPTADDLSGLRVMVGSGMLLADLVELFLENPEHRDIQARRELAQSRAELIELPAFKLYISEGDFLIGQAVKKSRMYEPHVASAIEGVLRRGMTFVDVGANVGFHSLLAAGIVGPTGRVYSFEPNLFNCSLLLRSIAENGFDNLELFPFAAADTERLMIYDDIGGSNGKVAEYDPEIGLAPGRVLTRSLTLDNALGNVRVHLIKMDVEGAEYLVVKGARKLLERDRPFIITEFSGQLAGVSKVSGLDYLQLLADLGYSLSILSAQGVKTGGGTGPQAVYEAWERCEGGLLDLFAIPM